MTNERANERTNERKAGATVIGVDDARAMLEQQLQARIEALTTDDIACRRLMSAISALDGGDDGAVSVVARPVPASPPTPRPVRRPSTEGAGPARGAAMLEQNREAVRNALSATGVTLQALIDVTRLSDVSVRKHLDVLMAAGHAFTVGKSGRALLYASQPAIAPAKEAVRRG